jgi:hypothetical protein
VCHTHGASALVHLCKPVDDEAVVADQAFFDLFVVAHFLGSLVKTLILRDWKLALALLLVWEVMEYSFQHLLPNFAECWWDHWILGTYHQQYASFYYGITQICPVLWNRCLRCQFSGTCSWHFDLQLVIRCAQGQPLRLATVFGQSYALHSMLSQCNTLIGRATTNAQCGEQQSGSWVLASGCRTYFARFTRLNYI